MKKQICGIDNYVTEERKAEAEQRLFLSRRFAGEFNLSVLENLSLEDYAIGHGDHNNFCYRIERELIGMGDIRGMAASRRYGVWYSKEDNEYHCTARFGKSPQEAWTVVRSEIIALVRAGAKEDYATIRESMLSALFRYKILSVYYPDLYITIFSDGHLSYFCKELGIVFSTDDDTLTLQRKLVLWKENHQETRNMSLVIYVMWLYDTLGHPPKSEWKTSKRSLRKLSLAIQEFDMAHPDAKYVEALRIERSALVSAYVKERANGLCQLCGKPAPFYSKNGSPYLECHHIVWMSRNGADEPSNAVALCPNCHRKMHILDDLNDVEHLKKIVS